MTILLAPSETAVALPSLDDLEPLPSRYEQERRTVPAWLRGETAQVIELIQLIEDVDIVGPVDTLAAVQGLVPSMLGREVETLISWSSAWLDEAAQIECGARETTFANDAWESEVEDLRGKAVSDVAHAIATFGAQS